MIDLIDLDLRREESRDSIDTLASEKKVKEQP